MQQLTLNIWLRFVNVLISHYTYAILSPCLLSYRNIEYYIVRKWCWRVAGHVCKDTSAICHPPGHFLIFLLDDSLTSLLLLFFLALFRSHVRQLRNVWARSMDTRLRYVLPQVKLAVLMCLAHLNECRPHPDSYSLGTWEQRWRKQTLHHDSPSSARKCRISSYHCFCIYCLACEMKGHTLSGRAATLGWT